MRVPSDAASAATLFCCRFAGKRRRTMSEPVSVASRRVSAASNWFMSGLWPPALTTLKASRKPLLKISAWFTL
jgi:hypothetical protein